MKKLFTIIMLLSVITFTACEKDEIEDTVEQVSTNFQIIDMKYDSYNHADEIIPQIVTINGNTVVKNPNGIYNDCFKGDIVTITYYKSNFDLDESDKLHIKLRYEDGDNSFIYGAQIINFIGEDITYETIIQ